MTPLRALGLLWLAGVALRLAILAVPPVIPLIHDDLHLSETQVGVLSGLPMVLFAGAAIAGSLMIAHLGAKNALLIGIMMGAAGSALRGVGPNIAMLFLGTVVMAFGVAVMQPSLPPLVRAWVPQRTGFATAVYTNGLLVGEILPTALTIPLVLPLLHQSWQGNFALWAGATVAIGVAILALAPPTDAAPASPTGRQWMPDFRNPLIWRIGIALGCVNANYFAMNGFLPDYLTRTGQAELINAALTALNLGQLPASILLLASADRMIRTMWSYMACGLTCILCLLATVLLGGYWVVAAMALWGCCGAAVLVMVLAIPPLIAPAGEIHRITAGIFTISYSCAVIVPIVSGALWDLTGWTLAPFIPIGVGVLGLIVLAPTLALREKVSHG